MGIIILVRRFEARASGLNQLQASQHPALSEEVPPSLATSGRRGSMMVLLHKLTKKKSSRRLSATKQEPVNKWEAIKSWPYALFYVASFGFAATYLEAIILTPVYAVDIFQTGAETIVLVYQASIVISRFISAAAIKKASLLHCVLFWNFLQVAKRIVSLACPVLNVHFIAVLCCCVAIVLTTCTHSHLLDRGVHWMAIYQLFLGVGGSFLDYGFGRRGYSTYPSHGLLGVSWKRSCRIRLVSHLPW